LDAGHLGYLRKRKVGLFVAVRNGICLNTVRRYR
jgi:hypothetical protein